MIAISELYDSELPKYQAIAKELAQAIVSGQLAAGEKLPPHRTLAARLHVTTGTISRAYAALERQGLAAARVGDGTYVRNVDDEEQAEAQADASIDLAHNVAIATDEGKALQGAFAHLSQMPERLQELMAYQPETGHKRHRMAGAAWLQRYGTKGAWNRVMVTHGAQHGLACVLRALARPGDTLLTEPLSYPGLLALARSLRLQLISVEMDLEGMVPEALDKAVQTFNSKLVFCTPSLHNPTSSSMTLARREAIAEVAQRRGLFLIEDTVNATMQPDPLPAISSLIPQQSFLLSSFSKSMAPGLRVGYLEASPEWLNKIAASMRADCWMVAPLMPEIASIWLENGEIERLVALQRQHIGERMTLAKKYLGGLEYRSAQHCSHIWVPLPEPWRADQFATILRQSGVLVRTADHFAVGRTPAPHAVRISLNAVTSLDALRAGLQVVVSVLQNTPVALMED